MDIVTLGAALNGSAEYVNSHFKGGSNIQIVDNPDGTQTINASGEVSAEDTVARADIAAIKDGESLDSFADVETALGSKQDTISDLSTIRSGAALGATAVQPETGKGLSTNDYTTTEKTKLAGIAEGAEVNVQANWTQTTSTADDYIKNKPTLGTAAALDVAASGNASTSQVVKGNDTRLSDARNAADVSSWAKAANKPSYNGSEIALTGYAEAQSKASVAATDTANAAIGKLEYRVETNENNILSQKTKGYLQKNLSKDNSLSDTRWIEPEMDNLYPAGNYVLYCGTITSADTTATTCAVVALAADKSTTVSTTVQINRSNGSYIAFTANNNFKYVRIYASSTGTASTGKAISATDIMVCTAADWAESQVYQPYAISNVELTAKEQVNENNILSNTADIYDNWTKTKNILKNNATSQTVGEAVFTVNADKSITVYTTATTAEGRSLSIASTPDGVTVNSTDIVSGTPITDKDVTMQFGIGSSGNIKNVTPDNGYTTAGASGVVRYLTIFIRANVSIPQSNPLVFKPMICTAEDWQKSKAYFPHAMSNVELTSTKLDKVKVIADNTDYNNLTDDGIFACLSSASAATMSNCPVTNAGHLVEVFSIGSNKMQRITFSASTGANIFTRYKSSYGWMTWFVYTGTAVT